MTDGGKRERLNIIHRMQMSLDRSMKTAVVAIGGNAILRKGEEATLENQMANLRVTCSYLANMIKSGYDIVITHGNGPQVGNILLQNELSRKSVPAMPLDICVAESQGLIGYMIQQALTEELEKIGIKKEMTCMITRVLVDENDPAFQNPTKPIGPYYAKKEADELRNSVGWTLKKDKKRGGYRRVVPSPKPLSIIEGKGISRLIFGGEQQNEIIIASGGGGIPVVRKGNRLIGVEAVIDKDLAASVLACDIQEKLLILLTDVDRVYLDYFTDHSKPLDKVVLSDIIRYYGEGHFPEGTMGPKIEAAIRFIRCEGKQVIITTPELLEEAMRGRAGTHIVPG